MEPNLSREEIIRYSRHILLPQVGLTGQQKLKHASVLILGTGGLGSPAAMYLAAAGVGHIGLVDFDSVDTSNLQRQIVHSHAQLGTPKVESARQRLLQLNPSIDVIPYNEPFTSDNARRILYDYGHAGYDVLLDCSDNFATRYLTNDLCVLEGKPNVFGAISRFDGQASVFDARRGPCYRCLFPEPPAPGTVFSCAVTGVLGVLPGVIGTIMATEAIKLILDIGEPLIGRLMLYSALDMTFDFVKLRKNPHCNICSPNAPVQDLVDYEMFCGTAKIGSPSDTTLQEWDISAQELYQRLQSDTPPLVIDVREPQERQILFLPGSINVPSAELSQYIEGQDREKEIVVLCRSGQRSARAREQMALAGFKRVYNLKGGILAWANEIEPALPVY